MLVSDPHFCFPFYLSPFTIPRGVDVRLFKFTFMILPIIAKVQYICNLIGQEEYNIG